MLNSPSHPRPALISCPGNRSRGVALIIVLGFLVLITALVVAYFTSVTTERSASKTYASGASTKMLTETAVNIVEAQIAQATQGIAVDGATRQTWASQPGMIRTFDTNTSPSNPNPPNNHCYKLYSSNAMVIPSGQAATALGLNGAGTGDVPLGWIKQPAIYTDLNAPVKDIGGNWNFPILDGNNLMLKSIAEMGGSPGATYATGPNINPRSSTTDIEGFYINPTAIPAASYNPAAISGTSDPVPMPVQWLYSLQDGTIIAPDPGGNGTTATFTQAAKKPSTTNPIVGRIAFWTDDETCKLNINTASEGVPYDMPRANTPLDMEVNSNGTGKSFVNAPPILDEFNRYPGHPASTCLSVALGFVLDNPSYVNGSPPTPYTAPLNDNDYLGVVSSSGTLPSLAGGDPFYGLSAYMLLSPRNQMGGSYAGTIPTSLTTGTTVAPTDTDRLYASTDEAMFRYPSATDPAPPGLRVPFPNPNLSGTRGRSVLEELKFFLTTSSRAPELTPFNTPKVSLWPQWGQASDRASYQGVPEQLLAFCSSFGAPGVNPQSASTKYEYFWEWSKEAPLPVSYQGYSYWYNGNAYSSTGDWLGLGGSSNYSSNRNQAIATYLCNLGKNPIPGYGAAFRSAAKYSDRCFSNIVVDCLDYIRTCVDRMDYVAPAGHTTSSRFYLDFFGVLVPPLLVADNTLPGVTQSTPIKGYGFTFAFPTVGLIANLVTSGSQSYYYPTINFAGYIPTWAFPDGQPQQETFSVNWNSLYNLGITTSDPPPANGQWTGSVFYAQGVGWGPFPCPFVKNDPIYGFQLSLPDWRFTNPGIFVSSTDSGASLTMGGGPLQFSILDSSGTPFQTESINFPSVTIPFPPTANGVGVQPPGTVSRSMDCNASTVAKGDYRILAGSVNVSSDSVPAGSGTMGNLYYQSAGYVTATGTVAYSGTSAYVNSEYLYCRNKVQLNNVPTSLIEGTLAPSVSATSPPILSSSDYGDVAAPLAPEGLLGAKNINGLAGDWDTGAGAFPDGPWIDARDQGDTATQLAYWPSNFFYGQTQSFSPNKRIASAIQFGSIPTGVSASINGTPTPRPWETLLFCPNPPARPSTVPPGADTTQFTGHIGFVNPPDHLFAEFFTMPVVQPYAISEPLSTAGKVNLNYQIAPFSYIERSTALHGVLKNTLMTGISGYDVKSQTYKSDTMSPNEIRYNINRDATIAGINEHYFSQGNLFMYPSQICDVFLVPQAIPGAIYNPNLPRILPTSYDAMLGWWNPSSSTADPLTTMVMTGENLREEPYDRLYPRLTTKSNTYTVHYRVQALQKSPNSNPATWTTGRDQVLSEYRGSSLIERYVDPNDPYLNQNWDNNTIGVTEPQGGSVLAGTSCDLSQLYKFRVISTKKFAP